MQGQAKELLRALRSAMAMCMAVVLLSLAFFAANGPLHKAWMHHGTSSGDGCAICLFAHAQVALTDLSLVLEPMASGLLAELLPVSTVAPWDITLFLPPGRAPPTAVSNS